MSAPEKPDKGLPLFDYPPDVELGPREPEETPPEQTQPQDGAVPPPSGEGPDAEVPAAGESEKSKPSGVGVYLVILFMAAFTLLLLAYFMQQRASEETIGNLTQSITSLQSLEDLYQENQELRAELEAMEAKVDELQEQLESKEAELRQAKENEAALQEALDLSMQYYAQYANAIISGWEHFYDIETAYLAGDYALCATRVALFRQAQWAEIPSRVQERYQFIKDDLEAMGYDTGVVDESLLDYTFEYTIPDRGGEEDSRFT